MGHIGILILSLVFWSPFFPPSGEPCHFAYASASPPEGYLGSGDGFSNSSASTTTCHRIWEPYLLESLSKGPKMIRYF